MERISGADLTINGNKIIGTLGQDGKIHYDHDKIRELIAGESQKTTGRYNTTAYVTYRYDSKRKTNVDNVYELWKESPIIQNRINQLNALVFGTELKWIYDESTQQIVDRFWRVNRLRDKLDAICTDAQLNGEVFFGLFPQASGDVLLSIYTSKQVDIDFNPADVYNINRFIVTYKDEEKGTDEQIDLMPLETYLNNIEFSNNINSGLISKVKKMLGGSTSGIKGKGVMCHIKFNNSSGEVYGTSDFKQGSDYVQDYENFVGDRFTVHEIYGSPAYDITIKTDDPQVIEDRINELAGFGIGSNPVHNENEEWKPLEHNTGGINSQADDKLFRGMLCAALSFPEFMLFNQSEQGNDDNNTFSITRLAQNRQARFKRAFMDIHKFVVAVAGGDINMIDQGQILFPEIDTTSEKTKAETYVLKVGANIVSRRTAAMNMGHNWDIEQQQILDEAKDLEPLMASGDFAGAMGGRFTSRQNNAASGSDNADDGTRDRRRRSDATRADTTQVVNSDRKRD